MKGRRGCGFLLLNVLVIALILEIGFRIAFRDFFPPRLFEPHAQFGHFHRPNVEGIQRTAEYESHIKINSRGLRDQEYPYEKPEGVFRVLVMGDSFVEGLQVEAEDTFPKVLETRLAQSSPLPVEVINAGVSRYGTSEAVLFFEAEGINYQPDLVIYALYPNDITDNIASDLFRLEDGELIRQPIQIDPMERVRGFFYDTSYLYRVGLSIVLKLQQQQDETLIETGWGLVLPIYRADLQPREQDAWALEAALLTQLRNDAGEIPVMVVYLPEQFQTEDVLWEQVRRSDEVLDRDAPNHQLAAIIPAGVTFLDLSEEFRQRGQGAALYYDVDGHFNEAGHALAAQLLEPLILETIHTP
jgi:lysophospholipase L1-like esterase